MPVVNGFHEKVGVGFPRCGVNIDTDGGTLSCPTCGRKAAEADWPEVRCGEYGSIPRICPDCEDHNIHSVPVPARRRPEPRPEIVPGGRVQHRERGAGRVIARHDPDPSPLGFTVAFDDGSYGGPYRPDEIEPADTPSVPVAAAVVRGLADGETAAVVLCRSELEAAREQRARGGVVVAASQIVWA
jgi:hypothetical protein